MDATGDMQFVLHRLRGVRALAIKTLQRDFPDLYALSIQAFEVKAPGSIDHHMRLGEFLTEWSNALGKSPIEALASGGRTHVLRELADRSVLDPESIGVFQTDTPQ